MTTKLQKAIAITCLVSLIVASVAIAADEKDNRKPTSSQDRGRGGGGRGGRGTEGAPARGGYRVDGRYGGGGGYGGGRGMMGGGMMGMGPGRDMQAQLIPEMIKRRLKLTEEQNKKLQDIQQQQTKKSQKLSKAHQDLRIKLDTAIDKSNKEAITKIALEMGKNIADTALLKVSGKESLKEILSEDQLKMVEKFNKQISERREKMRKQMEQRMRGGGAGYRGGRGADQDNARGRGRGAEGGRGRSREDQNRRERPRQ